MRLKPPGMKRFLWVSAGPLAVAAVLVSGSPSMAAEGARFVPAERPVNTTATAAPENGRAVVRVISIPLQECPADDNEGMNAVKAFLDPATGELRAPTAEEAAALARAIAPRARRAEAAREPMVLANGIVTYEIGEDGMVDVVVRTGADGKSVFLCAPRSETPKALTRPLAPKKSEAAKEEK
ncbi:MAG TPA: hypothetical protein VFZ57_04810, partial [Thermoanaerobaculia bacterium]|nr:hypothetical protein [Thermoanaerobaculia bacterium]